ncbi:MAG: threonylcarbamoyl-AMP synthase [Candidatus Aminicenantes bacterium]|nr:threonylcarbamoyl-AMP synthase [Candidatus Aminicenantes bacterium]
MKTRVLACDLASGVSLAADLAAGVMKRGGLVVFPTDTYYGLGGNGLSRRVIRKVYSLKRRDASKPLLVLVSGQEMAEDLAADIPGVFRRMARKFWPGPLTIVLRAAPRVPAELGAGTGTIAMRCPAVPWLRELVRAAGFPVIATSANISGEAEIAAGGAARKAFEGKVDLIVDGGETPGGPVSTVLDLAAPKPRIVREGAVPAAVLREALGL